MQWIRNRGYSDWVWSLFAILMVVGVLFERSLLYVALVGAAVEAVHFGLRHRGIRAFPSQVRFAYFLWLAAGFIPGFAFLHWIQAIGTTSVSTIGYCPLARMLLFAPWNRTVALNWERAKTIAFHKPKHGSVYEGLQPVLRPARDQVNG